MDADGFKQSLLEWWRWWDAQGASRKVGMIFGGTLICGLIAVAWWSAQPEYRALYTGMAPEEMGPITAKLKNKGIPFKLDSNGTTLLVRAEQAAQIHVDLSTEGVVGDAKIGKGLERFETPMWGATPFERELNLIHAQQSDLARTIMQIDSVVYARVHIAKSQTSFFMRERKPATASVMLKLRPGATMDRNALRGIASFVAGSIDGLSVDDVRIMDGTKKILYESRDSDNGYGGSIVEHQKELETYLAQRVERMLTPVLGPGRIVVTVRADLNSKLVKERSETPISDGKFVKKEKQTTSKVSATSAGGKGGAAGTSANLNRATSGGEGGGNKTSSDMLETDYAFPVKIQEIIQKYGDIDRLSIAAVVDLSSGSGGDPLMNLEAVQELIKKATGFKLGRDQIQVTEFKLPTSNADSLDEEWASHQRLQTILTTVRNGSIAAVTLCIGGLGFVYLRRRLANVATVAPAAMSVSKAGSAPEKLQRISEEFSRNPEELARVLSRWMEQSEAPDRVAV
jgi:flagellar M-ring protein FliF